MSHLTTHFNMKKTSQSQAIPGKQMSKNNAGGYGFEVTKWTQLNRFLVLGTEGSTYYTSEQQLTLDNVNIALKCLAEDPGKFLREVASVSEQGLAPKNTTAVFCLALALTPAFNADVNARRYAEELLPKICRTSTHLFEWIDCCKKVGRGGGRIFKRAIQNWYNNKTVEDLAYQVIKYRQRKGYTHRDVLRIGKPIPPTTKHKNLYSWIVKKSGKDLPKIINAFTLVQDPEISLKTKLLTIVENKLPWEAIPTELLNEKEVWKVLLPSMPLTALIRNLGNMSKHNVLVPFSKEEKLVLDKLGDKQAISNSRLHPITIYIAIKTYSSGMGFKGTGTWEVNSRVCAALEKAFYLSFGNASSTGKNILAAIDKSGSMSSNVFSVPNSTVSELAGVMSLTLAKTEPNCTFMGFGDKIEPININESSNLKTVEQECHYNMGGTDCSLPMIYALNHRIDVDTFITFTDNESWAGSIHPIQALANYNKQMNRKAKLISVAMTPNNTSICPQNEGNVLDIAGFDASIPIIMYNFIEGNI